MSIRPRPRAIRRRRRRRRCGRTSSPAPPARRPTRWVAVRPPPGGDPPPRARARVGEAESAAPAGAPPDPRRWDYDTGRWRDGGEDERYTDRAENVSLDGNGNLRIVARLELSRD